MLKVSYPEIFRVYRTTEGISGNGEGAGSADRDQVGSFEMFDCKDDFTTDFDVRHYYEERERGRVLYGSDSPPVCGPYVLKSEKLIGDYLTTTSCPLNASSKSSTDVFSKSIDFGVYLG